jgi:hypothetical protein
MNNSRPTFDDINDDLPRETDNNMRVVVDETAGAAVVVLAVHADHEAMQYFVGCEIFDAVAFEPVLPALGKL